MTYLGHLLMHLLAICTFSLEKCLQIFCPFKSWVCLFIVNLENSFMYSGYKSLLDIKLANNVPILWIVFTFLIVSF
uniref:Putative secreted protein n=1 Tax=Desmodus rotundus TaxID=9430 RepID=K9IFV0_DESRO